MKISLDFLVKNFFLPKWIFIVVFNFQFSLNLLSTLFLATMGQKYGKFESKLHKNPSIYSEILKKFPLWADFSKSALQIILKMVFFHEGEVPNRFQQEVERRRQSKLSLKSILKWFKPLVTYSSYYELEC